MFGACETFDAECPSPTCKGVSLATTPSTSLARVGETFTDLWTDLILSPKDTTIRPAARKSALTLNLFNIPRHVQREFPEGSQVLPTRSLSDFEHSPTINHQPSSQLAGSFDSTRCSKGHTFSLTSTNIIPKASHHGCINRVTISTLSKLPQPQPPLLSNNTTIALQLTTTLPHLPSPPDTVKIV